MLYIWLKGTIDMKKAFPVILLTTLMVASCLKAHQKYGFYSLKDGVDTSTLHGTPWLNTSIIGMANKVYKPSPKDDFFTSANYDVLVNNVIPEGSPKGGGLLYSTNQLVKDRLNDIMSTNTTFLSLKKRMKNGDTNKIKEEMDNIINMTNAQFENYMSSVEFIRGSSALISMTNDKGVPALGYAVNSKNQNILTLMVSLLIYQQLDVLTASLEEMGVMVGYEKEEISQIIQDCSETLLKFAAIVIQAKSNKVTTTKVKSINEVFPSIINAKKIFNDLGLDDEADVGYSELAYSLANYLKETYSDTTNFKALKEMFAVIKLFENRFFFGAENYKNLCLNAFANSLMADPNVKEDTSIDEVSNYLTNTIFPEVVERDYCNKYITAKARNKTKELINDVVNGFTTVLENSDWLTNETKQKALEKMSAMRFEAFYSDQYESYKPFTYTPSDLISNYDDYSNYYIEGLFTIAFSSDILHMGMPVSTVNAAYSPQTNSFRIFHGIVSSFIDDELTKEELYGRIGTVIGHEITHGFDSTGALYDKDGEVNNWWTEEDQKKFQDKIDKIVDYYENKITVLNDGTKISGAPLTGEIIADMGGMKTMIELGKKIKGFKWDVFFKSFAMFYNFNYTIDSIKDSIKNDPHPIGYLRVNVTAAQFDKFQETYKVKEKNGMYIAPEDRIAIW